MTAKKKPARTIHLERSPAQDGIGVFRVTQGKECNYYTICEIPCDIGGRGFAVHKLGLGLLYHVRIGTPEDCSCECMGFLAHGKCRHIEGLTALAERGLL